MDPTAPRSTTPPAGTALPAPAQPRGDRRVGPGTLLAVVLLATTSLLGARTARQLRALRELGAQVPPLQHELVLDRGGIGSQRRASGREASRRVVVLGDSAAAGHGLPSADHGLGRLLGRALHERDGRRTEVVVAAVDGATTRDVLERQIDAVLGAEVVVLGVGVNDAIHRRPLRRVRRELRQIVSAVRARAVPAASVVLLSSPDLSAAPGLPAVLRPAMGWRCRAVARAQRQVADALEVPVVEVGRGSLPPEVFGPDGFHPGVVGHARIAEAVLDRLGPAVPAPSTPGLLEPTPLGGAAVATEEVQS